jgi:mono/diheme cytochrome c family protein
MSIRRAVARILMVVGALAVVIASAAAIYLLVLSRRGFSAREQPSAVEAWIARVVRTASIPDRAKRLQNPIKPSPEVLADARGHWADHCAICHANDGSGNTLMGRNMFPKPPDMRHAPTQDLSDGELYYIVQNGVRLTGMPAWGAPVDDDRESWGLVAFVRHLPALAPEEEREIERLRPKSMHELEEMQEEEKFLNEHHEPNGGNP